MGGANCVIVEARGGAELHSSPALYWPVGQLARATRRSVRTSCTDDTAAATAATWSLAVNYTRPELGAESGAAVHPGRGVGLQ